MRTYRYLVYRYGSNAANQTMTDKMAVAIVDAPSRKAAVAVARDRVTCYANQYLEAVPRGRASASDWDDVAMREAMETA